MPPLHLMALPAARRTARISPRVQGVTYAICALVIWGSWFAVTRLSFAHVLGPADIAVLRVGGGALVLVPFVARDLRDLPARAWREGAILALCWGVPFVLLIAAGIRLTTATHAALMAPSLTPVFAFLIAWAVRRARPARARLAGIAVILIGVGTQLVGSGSSSLAAAPLGNLALMTASAIWAIYTVRLPGSGLAPMPAAAVVALLSVGAFLPIYLLAGLERLTEASAGEIVVQGLYQGVLVGALSVFAFNKAVAALGPVAASAITALVPVVATLTAVVLLGETPTPGEALATLCIAGGVFLAARQPRPPTP